MSIYDGSGNAIAFDETVKIPFTDLPTVSIECPDAGADMAVLADGKKHDISIKYIDGEQKFSLFGTAKKQGNFSSTGKKKNLNVTLFTDKTRTKKQKITFGSWYPMSKFHIKGNESDYSMVRNSVLTRIAYRFCGGLSLPNGAWGYIDSFPVILYWNGGFYGCYTWNLPQDDRTFNFDKKANEHHMAWRIETPANWQNVEGWEFRGDEDNLTAAMSQTFQGVLDIMASPDALTKAIVEAHFDVNSLLSYILFLQIGYLNDNTINNWTLACWDGATWYHILYDMDIGFGFSNGGTPSASATLALNPFHAKVETLFADELKAVYAQIRRAGLTADYVTDALYEYQRRWGWQNLAAEYEMWESDKTFKVGLDGVRAWLSARLVYLDGLYDYQEANQ